MLFFLLLSVLCFGNMVYCGRQLNKYKNGAFKNVRLHSFNKVKTTARGSTLINNSIYFYELNIDLPVELPFDPMQKSIEATISTTNRKAKKYKDMEYIDVFVVYRDDSQMLDNVYIKEDLKTPSEKYASLVLGAVFLGIFLVCLYLNFA